MEEFAQACFSKGEGWHCLTAAEWGLLADTSLKLGTLPHGNTNCSHWHGDDKEQGIIIEDSYKTLTGSGPATWTHDHTASGVHDLCGNIWEFARGVRIRDGALWAAENNDAALPETDLTECGDGWKPITDAEGHPLYVAVEDDKITFNTYPSVHRDYCGCVWGNVRMNCDSEQLRALALFAGEEKRKEASTLAQQTYNDNRAKRYHVQLVNANFGKGDFSWTGTYDDDHHPEPGDTAKADRDLTNYIKRLYRWCDKNGVQRPKWVAATEYCTVQEDGTACGRHHHHAIIQHTDGLTRDVLEQLWADRAGQIGFTRCEYLDVDHGSVESLVRYISKNKRCARSWRQSRGLEKPKTPPPNDTKWSRKKLDEARAGCTACR